MRCQPLIRSLSNGQKEKVDPSLGPDKASGQNSFFTIISLAIRKKALLVYSPPKASQGAAALPPAVICPSSAFHPRLEHFCRSFSRPQAPRLSDRRQRRQRLMMRCPLRQKSLCRCTGRCMGTMPRTMRQTTPRAAAAAAGIVTPPFCVIAFQR